MGRYPKAFRKMAVERLKSCDNIVALSEELGVHRRLLYKWRDQLEPIDEGEAPPENSTERESALQVAQLKRLLAEKTLEAGFFQRCLAKSRGSTPEQQAALARRHLRPNPGSDVLARQLEYRADVSVGPGESGRLLSIVAGAAARRRRDGSAIGDSTDRRWNIGAATAIGG